MRERVAAAEEEEESAFFYLSFSFLFAFSLRVLSLSFCVVLLMPSRELAREALRACKFAGATGSQAAQLIGGFASATLEATGDFAFFFFFFLFFEDRRGKSMDFDPLLPPPPARGRGRFAFHKHAPAPRGRSWRKRGGARRREPGAARGEQRAKPALFFFACLFGKEPRRGRLVGEGGEAGFVKERRGEALMEKKKKLAGFLWLSLSFFLQKNE